MLYYFLYHRHTWQMSFVCQISESLIICCISSTFTLSWLID
ncbi:hypothetical protein AALP_AA3G168400 [Arabis alpina]|uniref:Uncharacterized protein n=1 Tax=Arabis alpina TaxID=50452 RepID=A0A087H9P8_ARAAL|nr:hypothetical protein AALP_AA3G168400 [Arabis alpina]